jgi:hypothetical protein
MWTIKSEMFLKTNFMCFLVTIVMEQWYFTIFNYVIVTNKQYKIFWCRIHYYIFQKNYKLKHLIYFQFINLLTFIFSFNIEWKFAKYSFVKISNKKKLVISTHKHVKHNIWININTRFHEKLPFQYHTYKNDKYL